MQLSSKKNLKCGLSVEKPSKIIASESGQGEIQSCHKIRKCWLEQFVLPACLADGTRPEMSLYAYQNQPFLKKKNLFLG